MRLIINADDFGYSRAVNYGIIDAHRMGVLTSTTLMVTMPGLDHAIELYRQNQGLGLGLHLNVSYGQPLTNCPSLLRDGEFIKPKNYTDDLAFDEEEILQEFKAQYDKFIAYVGKSPSHLDSHLFTTDLNKSVAKCALIFAEGLKIPLRNHDTSSFEHVEFIQFRNFNESIGLDYVYRQFDKIVQYDCAEIMSHPAYIDDYLMKTSTYNLQRLDELEILVGSKLKELVEKHQVELITYDQVRKI